MDRAAALLEETRLLAALVREADPDVAVPTCPGWTLRQLVRHVGRGHRWAATIARDRRADALDPREVAGGKPSSEDPATVTAWLVESAQELLDGVAAAGPDTPVWTFLGPRPAGWWVRRRLHEGTVHRADAALALGVPVEMDAAVAADGVSEWLGLLAARAAQDPPALADGATLHLHATDELGADGEWTVRGGGGRLTWEHGHGKCDVAIRGTALDLLLGVLRRIPADDARLQVHGDTGTWTTYLARTGF